MTSLFRFLFVLYVFFLSGAVHSETIAATTIGYQSIPILGWFYGATNFGSTPQAACAAMVHSLSPTYTGTVSATKVNWQSYSCSGSNPNLSYSNSVNKTCPSGWATYTGSYNDEGLCYKSGSSYVCPTGQNWTLSGSSCTRPDCASGEVRNATTGICEPGSCPMAPSSGGWKDNQPAAQPSSCSCPTGTKWYAYNGCRQTCGTGNGTDPGQQAWGNPSLYYGPNSSESCYGGCGVQPSSSGYMKAKDGGKWYDSSSYTGWACSSNAAATTPPVETPKIDPDKVKPPICGATDGVLTTSTGKVMCVPAGTPDAPKPKVDNNKKTETFADNTTKTTETTTTTDPNTGAKDTQTTTTSSGGMSGSAGTSTTTESSSGSTGTGSGTGSGDCKGSDCGTGSGANFPDYGDLYTKKYDRGIKGVLEDKMTEIKGTPLFGLVGNLAPTTLANTGSCPSWSMSFAIGPKMNFGSASLMPSCAVFTFVRVVLLITAFLMARRLVFGG